MLRPLPALAVALLFAASSVPAQAQWLADFFHQFPTSYKRNVCWPKPFVQQDEAAVYAPFGAMVSNGWRKETLLGSHHFDENGNLSSAGEEKVRWILTQAPAQHRTIFVERGRTRKQTLARIDTVQQHVAAIAEGAEMPPVLETHLVSEGRPGAYVYDNMTRFSQKQPDPVLPAPEADPTSSQ